MTIQPLLMIIHYILFLLLGALLLIIKRKRKPVYIFKNGNPYGFTFSDIKPPGFIKNTENLHDDMNGLNNYFKNKITGMTNKRKRFGIGFIIIIVGPPGTGKSYIDPKTGKSYVLEQGYDIIRKKFHPDKTNKEISDTFYSINIDKIVYDVTISPPIHNTILDSINNRREMTGSESLKYVSDSSNNDHERIQQSGDVYTTTRAHVNQIPMIELYTALHLDMNIIFETLGSNWVLDYLINTFCNENNLIPIILYPVVPENVILERVKERAKTEYRWLDPVYVKNAIGKTESFYELIKKKINTITQIIVYKFPNHKDSNASPEFIHKTTTVII